MTILIVDDHPIVRKGIHALLASAFADAEVMDASCLKEAEEACSTRDVNIMITDLDLNGESGLTLIRRVRDILPSLQIVIYTMHEEPWSVCQIADIDTEGVVMKIRGLISLPRPIRARHSSSVWQTSARTTSVPRKAITRQEPLTPARNGMEHETLTIRARMCRRT